MAAGRWRSRWVQPADVEPAAVELWTAVGSTGRAARWAAVAAGTTAIRLVINLLCYINNYICYVTFVDTIVVIV